ncbi:hypothetical protein [Mucilaginibacter hurinus]|nr:hypothetical protein [Mucilaginibacter hurinus]
MHYKTLLTIAISILFINTAKAQSDKRAQNVYAEFLGPGITVSVNYDTRFGERRDGFGGRIGFGYFPVAYLSSAKSVPVQINYLVGKRSHFLEVGLGATYTNVGVDNYNNFWGFKTETGVVATSTVGYRYQPLNKGINFRLSANPLIAQKFEFSGGVSLGYTF